MDEFSGEDGVSAVESRTGKEEGLGSSRSTSGVVAGLSVEESRLPMGGGTGGAFIIPIGPRAPILAIRAAMAALGWRRERSGVSCRPLRSIF